MKHLKMQAKELKWTSIIIEVALAVLFFALFFVFPVDESRYMRGDGEGYLTIARNVAFSGAYSLSIGRPFEPTTYREPAYPFFLSLVLRFFGTNPVYLMLSQMFLLYLSAILFGNAASIVIGPTIGRLLRFFVLFYPTLIDYCRFALSEILALFLLSLFVFSFIKILKKGHFLWVIMGGFSFAALMLCKAMMFYFTPVVLFLFSVLFYKQRKLAVRVFFMCLLACLFILPWAFRVHSLSGKWSVTSGREGINLYARAYKLNYSGFDILKDLIFNFSENLGRRIFPSATDGLGRSTFTYRVQEQIEPYVLSLRAEGLSEEQVNNRLVEDSTRLILSRPFKYLCMSLLELEKMLAFNHFPTQSSNIGRDRNPQDAGLLRFLRYIYRLTGYFMFFAALLGFWLVRKNWLSFFPLISVLLFVNLFYPLLFAEGRFNVPVLPVIILFDLAFIKLCLYGYRHEGNRA